MIIPNFSILPGSPVGDIFIKNGVKTFYEAIQTVHNLPYGRVENPLDFGNIITQGKGTCSTKHATLKVLTEEHAIYGLRLELAIYAMNEENTPGVGATLSKYNLPYILEAHTFLCYDNEVYDYTFAKSKNLKWTDAILMQTTIDTDQIEDFKKNYHKSVLEDWIKRDNLSYTLEELYAIREECIAALSEAILN